jgi:thiol oxidase
VHFLAMVDEAKGIMKKRDGMLWSWRAHNRVNARLEEQETRGEAVGSGDPAFPKVQWPTKDACPQCHTGAGGEWNEDEVFKYLVVGLCKLVGHSVHP